MDKATVTNPPVSEPGDKTIVTKSSVPGSESDKELENRVRENLRAEYARETSVLKEKVETYEERIAELEDKGRLSEDDRELLERLRGKKDDLELEVRELETNPKYRAYNEKIHRESSKAKDLAKNEARWEMSVDLMEDSIEDWATAEGIEAKDLRKELNSILADGKYRHDADGKIILPHRRAKLAQKERLKSKELTKREDELKKKELELRGPVEDGQRNVRETSMDDLKKKGDTIGQAKKLGLIS